jgi:fructokinase
MAPTTALHGGRKFRAVEIMIANELFAGVEMGGTKCVCILGSGPDDIRAVERLPTRAYDETLRDIEGILERWRSQYGNIRALGVASFGPVDLRTQSNTYGFVTSTAKVGWRNSDVARRLEKRFGLPVGFDTDVNGAALAEGRWGAGVGLTDFAYVTVGTGIGVGTVVGGRTIFGMNHTELGHIRTARRPGDSFPGICSFHGDCVEGLASGPAIEARSGVPASKLATDHPAWDCVAHDLAQLLHIMVLTTAPQRIFLGGGVLSAQAHLFERVQRALSFSLNHYIEAEELEAGIAQYIVPPGLGTMSGPLGALALAVDADAGTARRACRPALTVSQ